MRRARELLRLAVVGIGVFFLLPEMHEGRKQTRCWLVYAGSRLKPTTLWEGAV
jgi:hypothetical protein